MTSGTQTFQIAVTAGKGAGLTSLSFCSPDQFWELVVEDSRLAAAPLSWITGYYSLALPLTSSAQNVSNDNPIILIFFPEEDQYTPCLNRRNTSG
jgi:hypothetical protein